MRWSGFGVWIVGVALVGCGGSDDPKLDASDIVLTRADGSLIEVKSDQGVLWCGPWENEYADARTLHIWVGASSDELREKSKDDAFTFWSLRAVVEHLQARQALSFPNTFISNAPQGVDLFVADVEQNNELSTSEADSSGTLTFEKFGCEPGTEIAFSVDAQIGSELGDKQPVTMKGTFRGRLSQTAPF